MTIKYAIFNIISSAICPDRFDSYEEANHFLVESVTWLNHHEGSKLSFQEFEIIEVDDNE